MTGHSLGLAQRRNQLRRHVVDLDRREAQPLEPFYGACLPHEPRQRVPGLAVAKAAEVDAGEHDLAVSLSNAAPDLAENGSGHAAPRAAPHERDHAEAARE